MRTALDILTDVAYVLVSRVVNTTLGTAVAAGSQTVTPGSMAGIYVGAFLVIDYEQAGAEQVTVTAVTATTFTAVFANAHGATASVQAPTMPEGYPDGQLFTEAELLQYLAGTQNEFLLRVRPIFAQATVNLTSGQPTAASPSDAIRIERVSHENVNYGVDALWNVAEPELDFGDPYWNLDRGSPTDWYQDGTRQAANIAQANIGFSPITQVNDEVTAYYSQSGPSDVNLLTVMLVPDVMAHYLKYGVLARCFGKDGEQKDPFREQYCSKRFEFGCFWAALFVNLVDHVAAKNGEVPPYTPLQIAPERGANALAAK